MYNKTGFQSIEKNIWDTAEAFGNIWLLQAPVKFKN